MKWRVVLLMALGVVWIAGCNSGGSQLIITPPATPTATATRTPTVTPSPPGRATNLLTNGFETLD